MSHLHLPDGVLPISWVAVTNLAVLILLFAVAGYLKGERSRRRIPMVAVLSAAMLLAMSIPLGPYHLNLSVLAGILAGPALSLVVSFIVNLFLAFIGHGGLTVVGLNTLIIASEMLIGYGLYRAITRWVPEVPAVAAVTVIAILLSTTVTIGVAAAARLPDALVVHSHHDEGHVHEEDRSASGPVDGQVPEAGTVAESLGMTFAHLAAIIFPVIAAGATVEGVMSGLILAFLLRTRPELVPARNRTKR